MADIAHSTGALAPHLRTVRLRPNAKTRQFLESALERLLSAAEAVLADLDAIDGDPDFEPSSGASHTVLKVGRELVDVDDDEHDGREPGEDEEYTLGWDARIDQGQLGAPSDDKEPELGEPERIDQSLWGTISKDPSLGWLIDGGEPYLSASEAVDQTGWAQGDKRDLEVEHEWDGFDEREPECSDIAPGDDRVLAEFIGVSIGPYASWPVQDDLPALKDRLDRHLLRTG